MSYMRSLRGPADRSESAARPRGARHRGRLPDGGDRARGSPEALRPGRRLVVAHGGVFRRMGVARQPVACATSLGGLGSAGWLGPVAVRRDGRLFDGDAHRAAVGARRAGGARGRRAPGHRGAASRASPVSGFAARDRRHHRACGDAGGHRPCVRIRGVHGLRGTGRALVQRLGRSASLLHHGGEDRAGGIAARAFRGAPRGHVWRPHVPRGGVFRGLDAVLRVGGGPGARRDRDDGAARR
jgi:hypothetical protein